MERKEKETRRHWLYKITTELFCFTGASCAAYLLLFVFFFLLSGYESNDSLVYVMSDDDEGRNGKDSIDKPVSFSRLMAEKGMEWK